MTVSEGGHQSTKGGSKKFQYGNNQNPPEPLPSFFTSPLPPSTLLPSPFPLPPSPSPRRQIMAVFLISLALSLSFLSFLAFLYYCYYHLQYCFFEFLYNFFSIFILSEFIMITASFFTVYRFTQIAFGTDLMYLTNSLPW